jgi:hypothetical protein
LDGLKRKVEQNGMIEKRPLTSEEISAIVDGLDPIDWVQLEVLAKLPPGQRYLFSLRETEMMRTDLRNKFEEDFPELSLPEINMKVLCSFTPLRMGNISSEPPYYGSLC